MSIKNLTTLIVEDDLIYAVKLHQWLKQLGIQQIELVENAELGKDNFIKNNINLVFLDKNLPDSKGTELIQFFKEADPNCFIILMSANYDVNDVALGIHNGADFLYDKATTSKVDIQNLIHAIVEAQNKNKSIWQVLNFFKNEKVNKHKRVIVLEDDELFSYHVGWILKECGKNSTYHIFENATDFYNSYTSALPDIIFLDYNLPNTNGEEVLKYIKQHSPKATVIIISSQEDPLTALKLKQLGIEDYIVKNKNWTNNLKSVIQKLDI